MFVNLPQDDKFVNASQFLYSIAILLSTPLQLFPAVRIMENGLFAPQKSGKRSLKVKWEKNAFRTLVVVLCAVIAWVGAADLDKFVSLIGSLAWSVCSPSLVLVSSSALTENVRTASRSGLSTRRCCTSRLAPKPGGRRSPMSRSSRSASRRPSTLPFKLWVPALNKLIRMRAMEENRGPDALGDHWLTLTFSRTDPAPDDAERRPGISSTSTCLHATAKTAFHP